MNLKRYILQAAFTLMIAPLLTSCLGDDDDKYDYTAWINQNETYFTKMQDTIGADGKKVFEKLEPVWAPGVSVLARWHNDRSKTAPNLIPMDNSTVLIKYEGRYVNGVRFGSSYSERDSLYSCKPSNMIVGFWTVLTQMHVGDSVTCVIPSNAGYGVSASGLLPYSTLVYDIKLHSIKAYETSGK